MLMIEGHFDDVADIFVCIQIDKVMLVLTFAASSLDSATIMLGRVVIFSLATIFSFFGFVVSME